MTASRYWTSPDGKRTIDLAAVVMTTPVDAEEESWRGAGEEGIGIAFAGSPDGFLIPGLFADSFLAALQAWREEQEKAPTFAELLVAYRRLREAHSHALDEVESLMHPDGSANPPLAEEKPVIPPGKWSPETVRDFNQWRGPSAEESARAEFGEECEPPLDLDGWRPMSELPDHGRVLALDRNGTAGDFAVEVVRKTTWSIAWKHQAVSPEIVDHFLRLEHMAKPADLGGGYQGQVGR